MQRAGLAKIAVALAFVCSACTCQNVVGDRRFACRSNDDCAADYVCRGGECRSTNLPPGACFAGETRVCTPSSCVASCGPDGGFLPCAPSSGGPFETNREHCGECGVACSTRLSGFLCVDARCTCSLDSDCPAGKLCNLGGVCVVDTDVCAKLRCPAGEVCRFGTCAPVGCAQGCEPGEVCDTASGNCRPIATCRLPGSCDGGLCEGEAKPDGEACDDGVACSFGDSCQAGSCSGTAYTCPPPGACQVSTACAGDGGCTAVALPDGTGCDDGDPCTFGDSCASGACSGTTYTCTPGICASTSVCAGDGGCLVTPRNAGSACDDGQACTHTDACSDAGFCTGVTYACPGVTECKQAGVCLGDGGCNVVDKTNGTACDAGTGCTAGDNCQAGVCMAGTPTTTYQDLDSDGRGNSNISQTVCPAPPGFVLVGGDCNDNSGFVFQVMAAVPDLDQDGVTGGTSLNPTACVGASGVANGRTYYRDTAGNYTWYTTASATADCNDNDGDVFVNRASMVTDADRDGYATSTGPSTICVGNSSVINGRTYYANTSGAFVYLDSTASMGTDCNDGDADIFTQRNVYADGDQDGWTTAAGLTSQCTGALSTVGGRSYYANATGGATWGATSLGIDCNDASASTTGPTNWYLDNDGDNRGLTSDVVSACTNPNPTAPGARVSLSGDCDDANINIEISRSVYADTDQDGWTTASSPTTQCTGETATSIGGRSYYRDASNNNTWVTTSLGVDCDDATAGTTGPTNWYLDADNDGFGLSSNFVSACTNPNPVAPNRRVSNSSDCNDSSANVYRTVGTVYDDYPDQDGYGPSAGAACVGAQTAGPGGRIYYMGTAGTYRYANTVISSSDCDQSNANVFTTRFTVVVDNDRDGCPASPLNVLGSVCAGATSTAGSPLRTYYVSASGGYYMREADCINYQGNGCRDPQDGNDANASVLCP